MVNLRDSVFEGSDPMLHMANLLEYMRKRGRADAEAQQATWQARQTAEMEALKHWLVQDEDEVVVQLPEGASYDELRLAKLEALESLQNELEADRQLDDDSLLRKWLLRPLLVWITADGGADHNIRHLAVKLSLLAFSRCIGAAKLSALRCCPHQSYCMTGEKAMSLLHLGIVNVSLARARMSEEFEAMVKNCSSMNDIREVAGMARKDRKAKAVTGGSSAKRTGTETSSAPDGAADTPAADAEGEEEGEHELEEVLNARLNARTGRQEYLIRWKSDELADSWEPESVLTNAAAALAEFLAKRAREATAATAAAQAEKERACQERQARFSSRHVH